VAETKLEVVLAAVAVVEAPTALEVVEDTVAALHLDGVSMALAADLTMAEQVKITRTVRIQTKDLLLFKSYNKDGIH
jgi:hypothetical protein